jgi:hypothetical protein
VRTLQGFAQGTLTMRSLSEVEGKLRLHEAVSIKFKLFLITYNFQLHEQTFKQPSYRHGLPVSRTQGRDSKAKGLLRFHPCILDPGNPCRGDDV